MKRGEIYFIRSTYKETGSEQRGDRPAVIVSNNNNNNSDVVEIVYMTTRPKNDMPTHVFIRSALSPSTLLCEQIHSVSKERVDAQIGTLTHDELQALDAALAISLGLNFGTVEKVKEVKVVREPTAEEWEAMRESVRNELIPTLPAPAPVTEQSADLIRLQTERDLYKKFAEDLMEAVRGRSGS